MFRRSIRRIKQLLTVATHSLAGRLFFGAAFIMLVSLGIGAVALPALFKNAVEKRFDRDLRELFEGLISVISDDGEGNLTLTDQFSPTQFRNHLSGWYWQVTLNDKLVFASDSLAGYIIRAELGPARDKDHYYNLIGPRGERVRVMTRDFGFGEPERMYVFTITANRDDLDRDIAGFEVTIIGALSALAVVLLATVLLQVRYGLGPLRRIPAALAAIRTGQSDRLTGSFSAEVEPLAHEINALLDHNAQVIERARTHVGNLAHALKTPIAVLVNEAAAKDSDLAGIVRSQAGIMREQVEHHLSRARTAARAGLLGARTSVMPILEALARTLEKIYRERNIEIRVGGPADIAFRGEKQDIEEMLGNLMDNACKWAKSRVHAKVGAAEGGKLRIEIGDDGPGVPASQRRAALKRGVRLDEAAPGSGLGLSIVTDTAEIYGGTFELGDSPLGGTAAILILPMAEQDESQQERPSRGRRRVS